MDFIDSKPFETEQFIADTRTLAQAIGAGFQEDSIRAVLKTFQAEFHQFPIHFKVTTKPGDGLYYRILDSEPINRTAHAREAGLIGEDDPRLLDLQRQILETCPGSFSAGIDCDAGFGLSKAWSFTGRTPIEALCQQVPSLPDSVREMQDVLRHFGLGITDFVASDFQHKTTNVYVGWDTSSCSEQWLQALAQALGTVIPSSETCYDILAAQTNLGCLGITFAWEKDQPLRWCIYAPEIPYDDPQPAIHLPTLPPRLEALRRGPSLTVPSKYILGWAFSPTGEYIKLERGYAQDAGQFMRRKMQVDLDRDKAPAIVLPRRKTAV